MVRTPNLKWLARAAGLLAMALLAGWFCLRKSPSANQTTPVPAPPAISVPSPAARQPDLDTPLLAAAKNLAGSADATRQKQWLALLRETLAAGSTNEVSAAIRRFLATGVDAPTGQGFKLGKNGFLTEAPTLRTWLMDYLAQIDPAAAAAAARLVLSTKDSPDEWALALRDLALGDPSPDGRALLDQKIGEMLQYAPWLQNPSTGFLEAFDVAVYLGDPRLLPTLSDLVRQPDNPDLAHAAFLAMDRLVINQPAPMLTSLAADPNSLRGFENTRADFFARADVRDPQQRQIVENYLLNPQISAAEKSAFTGIFPNANYMISDNLLTPNQTPDRAALIGRDAASLQALQQWLADPRFAALQPGLANAEQRLAGFVQQETAAH